MGGEEKSQRARQISVPRLVFLVAPAVLLATAAVGWCEIRIDSFQVSAGADDGYAWSATGQDVSSGYLTVGDDRTYTPPYYMSAMRFGGVAVPRSATIVSAYLRINSGAEANRGQIYGVVQGEAVDDAFDFASRYIGGATRTTAAVDWDHKDNWAANTEYTSPNIAGVVQEIVDRAGWSAGNSLAVFYSTRAESGKSRTFSSFEGGAAAALEITYETYTISGYVTALGGTGLEGVAISAGADVEGTVTDAGGYYELQVPLGWSGTVTPSKTDWGFSPADRVYSGVASDQVNQDFTAFQPVISGYITDSNGTGVIGVAVSADNGGSSDITDGTGYYEIIVPYDWWGTVKPSKEGWKFEPRTRLYNGITANQITQNYDISPIGSEIVVLESSTMGPSMQTGGKGVYHSQFLGCRFSVDEYIKITSVGGHLVEWGGGTFFAAIVQLSDINALPIGNPLDASEVIDGIVFNPGYPSSEFYISLPVVLSPGAYALVFGTDALGASDGFGAMPFEGQIDLPGASYISWHEAGWFNSSSPGKRFVVEAITGLVISGHITNELGEPIEGVTVSADGGAITDVTDSSGFYELSVPINWSGVVTPTEVDWGFLPVNKIYSDITTDQTNQDYIAFKPKISGHIEDSCGLPIEDVTINSNNGGGTGITDTNGFYEIEVPYNWSGVVTPSKLSWDFNPLSIAYSGVISDYYEQNYIASKQFLIHTVASLSQGRTAPTATTVGTKVIIAGGKPAPGGSRSDVVDIYNLATGDWSTAVLSQARTFPAATATESKAFFAGGLAAGPASSAVVDIYDVDTGQWSTATLSQARCALAATAVDNKAMFAGGQIQAGSQSNVVDIYDAKTGQWSTATLSVDREYLAATTVGNKAMFAGGRHKYWHYYYYPVDVVDIYDANTGQWSTATLSQPRCSLAAVTVGNKALFAGGRYRDYYNGDVDYDSSVVDIYDADTGQWSTANLSQARFYLVATTVGNKAIFAGGEYGNRQYSNRIDIYDASTDEWSTTSLTLSQARTELAAAAVGNNAFFAGGLWCYGACYSDVVDIFTLYQLGDMDSDGDVEMRDFAVFASAWQSTSGEINWNPVCDISDPNDDVIDELDLSVFCENWLEGVGP